MDLEMLNFPFQISVLLILGNMQADFNVAHQIKNEI